jgi:hypothetical protein
VALLLLPVHWLTDVGIAVIRTDAARLVLANGSVLLCGSKQLQQNWMALLIGIDAKGRGRRSAVLAPTRGSSVFAPRDEVLSDPSSPFVTQ